MADYLGKKIKFNIEDNDLQKIRFNKVYGESQQATRSGKNLFDKDNANIINTYIAGSGNGVLPSDGGAENKCVYIPCKQNTTYTIQKMIGKRFGVAYTYETPAQGVIAYNKTVDNNVASITITTDSSAKYLVVYLRNGNASGEITLQQALDSLQIEKGSTATDYEPYGVMPSPDYLSPIENVEGKNKFDINQEKEIFGIMLYKYSYYLKPNTKYTISSNCPASTTANIYANSNSSNSAVYINKNQTIQSDENGYFYILVRFKADASDNSTFNLYEKVLNGTYYIQLEEGTVATPYVPYNSLEFKDVGSNVLELSKGTVTLNGVTLTSDGETITINGTVSGNYPAVKLTNGLKAATSLETLVNNYISERVAQLEDIKDCTIQSIISGGSSTFTPYIGSYNKTVRELWYGIGTPAKTIQTSSTSLIAIYLGEKGSTYNNYKIKIGINKGTVAKAYEPYQEQKEYFPLAEGQKLYKGSYLADDGIHHRRKQVVFDGTENWALTSTDNQVLTKRFSANITSNMKVGSANTALSTHFSVTENATEDKESMYFAELGTVTYIALRISVDKATTVEQLKIYLATEYANGTPVIVEYELAEEEIVPYTEIQQEAREKLRHFKGLNGENNITAQGTMTSTLDLTLYNVAEEDFDIYISKKGYFGALKYDINNLIDFTESNIPSIAEATESSVKIAGRDGDIPLNTVYEPLPFEIVCYTEDNLTPEEKIIEEQKITSLLNSIKNQTKTFFMEREKKFYKVKYSGNLSVVRYPKHLKFTIPLKSSESYAMNFEESEIIGNGTKVSNTIKDTGAIFTIKGPATKPIISLNNYQMKYNENILEGNSLIINSEDSTITHITSAGVKTNAMRAYNHEFPKIKNGENQLAVSSGIDDEKQVNVKWYDLKI